MSTTVENRRFAARYVLARSQRASAYGCQSTNRLETVFSSEIRHHSVGVAMAHPVIGLKKCHHLHVLQTGFGRK